MIPTNDDQKGSRKLNSVGEDHSMEQPSDLTITNVGGSTPMDGGEFISFPDSPEQLGKFRIDRILGVGGFGSVYLATDPDLNRKVAIKVPKQERLLDPVIRESFLLEARLAAKFNHPGLVSVYEVHTETAPIFIVLEYLSGQSFDAIWNQHDLSPNRAVELLIPVAEAIHYAHLRGLIHRDLKPSNVIMNADGHPVVTDFGLAVHDRGFASSTKAVAGTPKYMSPEQVRGETHRLDGRTDVWAIGVMLYRALTRRVPFASSIRLDLFDEIQSRDPKPPRQINAAIHRELERICLRCLAKRMSDRYSTAQDLADDLKAYSQLAEAVGLHYEPVNIARLTPTTGTSGGVTVAGNMSTQTNSSAMPEPGVRYVVPRGLRAFDESDADFFLSLLPGAIDRNGLPASLGLWKQHIESRDSERGFSVGLLYGPSGCGKSSFVRAGLRTRLDPRVQTLFVEATTTDTEMCVRRAIQRQLPQVTGSSLPELFFQVRQGNGLPEDGKLLIVFDQFEQWLHANAPEPSNELVKALRQCDGDRLQVLLLVRDDFGMAAVRFLQAIEVPLVEGRNYATIDLFDAAHARRVLTLFGQAYGQFPCGELNHEQSLFLDQAVASLAEHGRVVPVRLSLFAEMMRSKPWTAASLRQIGGAEGVGVAFLEECFGDESTNPRYRIVRQAASEVLRGLLPEPGSQLKGRLRSETELRILAGLEEKPIEFAELMRVLDGELRLITPTDSDAKSASVNSSAQEVAPRPYQLTHDYLVPALRAWFSRQQQATMRGRTRAMLERRAAMWDELREVRQLPTWLEWVRIRLLLPARDLTDTQRTMIAAATRIQLRRSVLVAMMLMTLTIATLQIRSSSRAADAQRRLNSQIDQILTADVKHIGPLVDSLPVDTNQWSSRMRDIAKNESATASERWNARMALARIEPSAALELLDKLDTSDPDEVVAIAERLKGSDAALADKLWQLAVGQPAQSQQIRMACMLSQLTPHDERWAEIADATTSNLVAENSLIVNHWLTLLQPVKEYLLGPLENRFQDVSLSDSERLLAANILSVWSGDDLKRLVPLALVASPRQHAALLASFEAKRTDSIRMFHQAAEQTQINGFGPETETGLRRKAMAILNLIRLGERSGTWNALAAAADPRLRTWLIDRLPKYGVTNEELCRERVRQENGSVRQAIVIMMDATWPRESSRERDLIMELESLATSGPDAGERSAAECVLRRRATWPPNGVSFVDGPVVEMPITSAGTWFRNSQGQVMVGIEPGEFQMGSPLGEIGREKEETQHPRMISRPYWISAHEVTITEFKKLLPGINFAGQVSPSRECPMNLVTWYDAIAYCRLLSEREKVSEDQMVYPPVPSIQHGLTLPADVLKRTGYRLPTEAEWEYAARAGTRTSRFFGETDEFAHDYACFAQEKLTPVGTFRPNLFGLFDTLGNVMEWCHSDWEAYQKSDGTNTFSLEDRSVTDREPRVLRGTAYRYQARELRSAKRSTAYIDEPLSVNGFRIARTGQSLE